MSQPKHLVGIIVAVAIIIAALDGIHNGWIKLGKHIV